MVVLVLTRSSWNTDNNTGNTISNLFEGIVGEMHSLYLRADLPKNELSLTHFHITERQLLSSLYSMRSAGEAVIFTREARAAAAEERAIYNRAKRWNSSILWLARELLWMVGRWKGEQLVTHVRNIKPDVVFMPAFGCVYPFRVLKHVARHSDACVVLYHTDDYVSLRQYRFSPLYWLCRLWLRSTIKRASQAAAVNYCITDEQREEYETILQIPCRLLRKPADFGEVPPPVAVSRKEGDVRLIYTGNVSSGRWQTLAAIGRILDDTATRAVLEIYSHEALTPPIERSFAACESIVFVPGLPSEEMPRVQAGADILVHVESLRRRERLETRLAFSTKLVDYFLRARCIFAVGWEDAASIAYLARNDAAVVASDVADIESKLVRLLADPDLRSEYGLKAWECGKRNHDCHEIHESFRVDLQQLVTPVRDR